MAKLTAGNGISRLEALRLDSNTIDFNGAAALAAANGDGHLPALRVLTLAHNPLGELGVYMLVMHPWRRLEELDLSWMSIELEPEGPCWTRTLAGAAAGQQLPALKKLALRGNDLHRGHFDQLAGAVWRRLEQLDLRKNMLMLGDLTEAAALGAASFPALRTLSEGFGVRWGPCQIDESGVKRLMAAWPGLQLLG